MTDVYVLLHMTACEGGNPHGVYTTLDNAKAAAAEDTFLNPNQEALTWQEVFDDSTWWADVPRSPDFYEIKRFEV